MFMGKNIQKNDIVLESTKYDEFVTLLKVIHPPHEEITGILDLERLWLKIFFR